MVQRGKNVCHAKPNYAQIANLIINNVIHADLLIT